ncbi:AfsR/SARP family transcriptional regulator [Actinocatenispora rupis]|uniref:SARP family transcriptional regulator n=1 Tax=Actinocatenispora rupis TaxID=519421 RepID=A0A8J3JF46_9ACTN|nr:AfsR/SARP family transcriptional regulator [Actinocatenispora rupis]GID13728.1 SARP family transcriptional regulator [Actinocatenispora rupis]
MEFGLLGPVEARAGGARLPSGSARERFVLATLLLNAGRLTPVESLLTPLWPTPPASAKAQLHNLVSSLRRRFRSYDADLIETRPTGYALRLAGHGLDLAEFRQLTGRGRRAAARGDHPAAASLLDQALGLWRGPALADVGDDLVGEARATLHAERLAALTARLDAALALGEHDRVLHELEPLLAEHPYDEELYARQMRAYAAAGRRADALAVYRRAYRRFVDELGVEPGARLRDIERQVLLGAPEPAATGPGVPRQLPQAVRLTGRRALLDRIGADLRGGTGASCPVVLLVGPGGVGKSALALAAGHRAADTFTDGQLYVDLRGSQRSPLDPHAVLGRFLRALGVPGAEVPADPEERAAAYRSRVAGGRTLVVLDDAVDERQVRPLLPGAGAVLVTSRRPLGGLVGAARYVPSALDDDAAVRLLAGIAGAERVAAEPSAAADIVGYCGGLPLAVCVAAARLAISPQWTLADFRTRLATERGRLDELAVGDLDVRASIGLSYDGLAAPARLLLRRLGAFGLAEWPQWLAVALSGGASAPLDLLTEVHLVEPVGRDAAGQHRYRLHDLVAEYAAERAADDEPLWTDDTVPDAYAAALRDWLGLASVADELLKHGRRAAHGLAAPEPPAAAGPVARERPNEWFDAEWGNLVAAVDHACRLRRADLAVPLALRLAGYLTLRAYDVERERVLTAAADCARDTADDRMLMRVLAALFSASAQLGRHASLGTIVAEEVDVARRLGDRHAELDALYHATYVAKVTGRLAEAAARADEGLALLRDGDPAVTHLLDMYQNIRGDLYVETGDPAAGVPLLAEVVERKRAEGRTRQAVLGLHSYGTALRAAGRIGEAERVLTEAWDISREISDALGMAYLGFSLGLVDVARRDWAAARERLTTNLADLERIGHPAGIAEALRGLGDAALGAGDPAGALAPLRRSLEVWRTTDTPVDVARTLARLDIAATRVGDAPGAAAYRAEWRAVLADLGLSERCLLLPYLPPDPTG